MFSGPRKIGGSYVGFVDPYRGRIWRLRAQGLSWMEVGRRLYDMGVRPPRSLFVQPRDTAVERESMADCIRAAIYYMRRRDALLRRLNGGPPELWG